MIIKFQNIDFSVSPIPEGQGRITKSAPKKLVCSHTLASSNSTTSLALMCQNIEFIAPDDKHDKNNLFLT